MSHYVYRLMERHQQLDAELRQALAERSVDLHKIARLKKLKLAIKDRLSRLMHRPLRQA